LISNPVRTRGFSGWVLQDSANSRASVFDLLEHAGTELLDRPYRERRATLDDLVAREILCAPFTLMPATPDRATALEWLDPSWGAVGVEGCLANSLLNRRVAGDLTSIRQRKSVADLLGSSPVMSSGRSRWAVA